jgi:hypothetical protein
MNAPGYPFQRPAKEPRVLIFRSETDLMLQGRVGVMKMVWVWRVQVWSEQWLGDFRGLQVMTPCLRLSVYRRLKLWVDLPWVILAGVWMGWLREDLCQMQMDLYYLAGHRSSELSTSRCILQAYRTLGKPSYANDAPDGQNIPPLPIQTPDTPDTAQRHAPTLYASAR